MSVVWKDRTGFSTKKQEARIWEAEIGSFRVTVHRHIHYDPDKWLLSVRPHIFDNHPLESVEIDDAKTEALNMLLQTCKEVVEIISGD